MMDIHTARLPRNRLESDKQSKRWRDNPIHRVEQRSKLATGGRTLDIEFAANYRDHSPASLCHLPADLASQAGPDFPTATSAILSPDQAQSYSATRNVPDREAYNQTSFGVSNSTTTTPRFAAQYRPVESSNTIPTRGSVLDAVNHGRVYPENETHLLSQPLPPPVSQTQPRVPGGSSSSNTLSQEYHDFPRHWTVEPSPHNWNLASQEVAAYPSATRLLQAEIAPSVQRADTTPLALSDHQFGKHGQSDYTGDLTENHSAAPDHNSSQAPQARYSSDQQGPRAVLSSPRSSILPAPDAYHYSSCVDSDQPAAALVDHAPYPATTDSAVHHQHIRHSAPRQHQVHQPHEQYISSPPITTVLPQPTRPEWRAHDSSPCNFSQSFLSHTAHIPAMGGGSGDPWIEVPVCSQPFEDSHYASPRPEIQYAPNDSYQDAILLPTGNLTSHLSPGLGFMMKQPYGPMPPKIAEKRTNKNKTHRRPFDEKSKHATAATRQRGACIRCRIQKLRCIPFFEDKPLGPCIECCKVNTASKKTMRSANCLHYNLINLQLARQGSLNLTSRWSGTKMHDVECLANSSVRTIEFKIFYTHDPNLPEFYDVPIKLEVRRFMPIEGDVLDRRWTSGGYGMVTRLAPFALDSIHASATAISKYIEENAFRAMTASVAGCDPIIRHTYTMAIRHWYSLDLPENSNKAAERKFLSRLFKVWFAMRLSTGSAYLSGKDKLDMQPESRPGYPLGDRISLPRMVTAQIDSILTTKIVQDETRKLKKELNDLFRSNNPQCWFTLYVSTFILLHEISVATQDRGRYARQNQLSVRFSLPELVAAQHQSANSLLAHWHYFKSDNDPGNTELHDTEKTPMKYLSQEQKGFVWQWWRWMTDPVIMRENCPDDTREQDMRLEDPLYFVSQMFLARWSPRAVYAGEAMTGPRVD